MAKKGFGKFVAFAAVAGAVAAGVSYIFQYKTFHKELEKDFREFEEDGEDDSLKRILRKRPDRMIPPRSRLQKGRLARESEISQRIPAGETEITFPLHPAEMNSKLLPRIWRRRQKMF